jgi:hypothetical protein
MLRKFKIVLFLLISMMPLYAVADLCSSRLNIQDYFSEIASTKYQVFDDERGQLTSKSDLIKAIKVQDVKNGYLELQNETILTSISAALFRKPDKPPIVVILDEGASVQNMNVFICKGHQWLDRSKESLPSFSSMESANFYKSKGIKINGKDLSAEDLSKLAHSAIRYRLPKRGTEIEAYAGHPELSKDVLLFKLGLQGERFEIIK